MLKFGGGKLNHRLFFAIALLFAFTFSACGVPAAPATSFPPVPADYAGKTNPLGADAATAGSLNYVSYCESCHGVTGLGDGPAGPALNPPPASLPVVAAQVGDDYLFWRISEGKVGTAMVGWGNVLSDAQVWQVVAYIRTLE
jgi:mono/diheme cytochrome c family protein